MERKRKSEREKGKREIYNGERMQVIRKVEYKNIMLYKHDKPIQKVYTCISKGTEYFIRDWQNEL